MDIGCFPTLISQYASRKWERKQPNTTTKHWILVDIVTGKWLWIKSRVFRLCQRCSSSELGKFLTPQNYLFKKRRKQKKTAKRILSDGRQKKVSFLPAMRVCAVIGRGASDHLRKDQNLLSDSKRPSFSPLASHSQHRVRVYAAIRRPADPIFARGKGVESEGAWQGTSGMKDEVAAVLEKPRGCSGATIAATQGEEDLQHPLRCPTCPRTVCICRPCYREVSDVFHIDHLTFVDHA